MGRTLLTATLQVYKFEQDWKMFARAPRKVDREAFSELCAFAHFYAAAIAHAASPYGFEMILLTMLVGTARRTAASAGHLAVVCPNNDRPRERGFFSKQYAAHHDCAAAAPDQTES